MPVEITSFHLPINQQAKIVLQHFAFPKMPCALPCDDTLFILSFSTALQILHDFIASPEILEYNSSLGCLLGHYLPLFKTLETRPRTKLMQWY